MQIVPTRDVPNQNLQIQLAEQPCSLNVYQLAYGLFVDVYINGVAEPIIAGVLAHNLDRIVRSVYLGFSGDLVFIDMQGSQDPIYTGLGTRYLLVYLDEADLETFGVAG